MGSMVITRNSCRDPRLPGLIVLRVKAGGASPTISFSRAVAIRDSCLVDTKGCRCRDRPTPCINGRQPRAASGNTQTTNTIARASFADQPHRSETLRDLKIGDANRAYEMAFRDAILVPESDRYWAIRNPKETIEMYGCTPGDGSFGSTACSRRRLAERGVRSFSFTIRWITTAG